MLECPRYKQAANWSDDGRGRACRTSWVMAQNPKGEAVGLGAGLPGCPSWDKHLSALCGKLISRKHQERHGEVRPGRKGKQGKGYHQAGCPCETRQLHPAGHGGCLPVSGIPGAVSKGINHPAVLPALCLAVEASPAMDKALRQRLAVKAFAGPRD